MPLAAKCSANRHSSPFSTADSGIRVDLFDGTRCALQFRELVRSMLATGTEHCVLRIVSSLKTCIAFRRRDRKRGKKICKGERSWRGRSERKHYRTIEESSFSQIIASRLNYTNIQLAILLYYLLSISFYQEVFQNDHSRK